MTGEFTDLRIKRLLLFSELLFLNLAFFVSFYLRYSTFEGVFVPPYLLLVLLLNLLWILLRTVFIPYQFWSNIELMKIVRKNFTIIILHFFLVASFFAFQKFSYVPRETIILTYLIFTPLVVLWRIGIIFLQRRSRMSGKNLKNVVIVGYNELAEGLNSYFKTFPFYGYNCLGYIDDIADNKGVIGKLSELEEYCLNQEVQELYVCLPSVEGARIKEIIDFGEDNFIKVNLIPDFRGFSVKGLHLERFSHIPVLNVNSIPLDDNYNRVLKRAFDFIVAFLFLAFIFSWLYPLIALLIKLDSKGPVFFKQLRSGKGNKPFYCYKFRTMVVNRDADTKQATRNDPRITKVGAFMRKTSIDELPQFINVLLGDMSVIGPRPHPLKLNEQFSNQIHKFMVRHSIKPGITGLAQAKGFRGETSTTQCMKNRVRLDLFYLSTWTFNLDLKIIWLTIISMISGSKNAF